MSNGWTANLVNILVAALLPTYIVVHAHLLPLNVSASAIADSGFISIITLTFIGGVLITLLTLAFNSKLVSSKLTVSLVAYTVLIYFLREADVHRLLTLEHVTRGKFYTMQAVPIWQKFLAAAVFIILAISLLYLIYKYTRLVWSNVMLREPWAIALSLWFFVLLISQICDRTDLNHTHFGRVIEECCECWAAIFMLLATVQIIPNLNFRKEVLRESIALKEVEN